MFYSIPKDTVEIRPEGTDLVLYPYERMGEKGLNYGLLAFMGKQSKAFHYYTYGTRKHDRDRAMEQLIENRKAHFQRKLDERARKKEFTTTLVPGDVLYTSWGYDQTNVDFYEVTKVIGGQTVAVRAVEEKVVSEDAHSEKVVPVPGKFVSPEMRVRVGIGDRAKIEGQSAHKWDGRPVYQTGPYGGH